MGWYDGTTQTMVVVLLCRTETKNNVIHHPSSIIILYEQYTYYTAFVLKRDCFIHE